MYLCGKKNAMCHFSKQGYCAINSSVTAVTSDGAPEENSGWRKQDPCPR